MDKNLRLLVLFILEGRHFPLKQACNIIIDAKFDGESLSSDPTPHLSNPNFHCELAWEINRRALHYLHIKRVPVKLQVFVVNTKSGNKESIGYIILDSRLAHDEIDTAKPKWYPILNSKYNPRPELLMCLGLDKYVPPTSPADENLAPTGEDNKDEGKIIEQTKMDLQPILTSDDFYQIGPADTCTDSFIFSFTVAFPKNLEKLITKSATTTDKSSEYFFYYSLLGNDIFTDIFKDLSLNDFVPEVASIKLRSSLPVLRSFFNIHSSIQVHLCTKVASLGSAMILLKDFIKQQDTVPCNDVASLPIIMEDCYEIKTSRHSQINTSHDEMKPVVGVRVCLKECHLPTQLDEVDSVGTSIFNSSVDLEKHFQPIVIPPEKLQNTPKSSKIESPNKNLNAKSSPEESNSNKTPIKSNERIQKSSLALPSLKQSCCSYELTIGLNSIKNLNDSLINASIKYSWPYFGNMSPILTDPPIYVSGNSESYLPQEEITVSFQALPMQLKNIFNRYPIPIEVMDNSEIIGKGSILLSHLINKISSSVVNENGKTVQRWVHSQTVSVEDINKINKKIAEIKVNLILDDQGFVEEEDKTDNKISEREVNQEILKRPDDIDPTIAEKVALEFEQWKEWQENIFNKKLKEKEKQHMDSLAAAWSQKEAERETLLKKRLTEYNELEEKLKAAMESVEKRERQLTAGEAELQRRQADLQSEYDRLIQEVQDVSRRVKEECAHKNELEKNKKRLLQDQCLKYQKQISDLEKKLESKEAEFQAYKELHSRPEIRLQSQINVLNLEKAELERKNEVLTKSKVHYKQQYGKCLKELARLKQAMQLEAQAQLQEKKKELLQMKLGLEKKQELKVVEKLPSTNRLWSNDSESNNVAISREVKHSCLNLLLTEKETLMQTGLYGPNDAAILRLDKEIDTVLNEMEK